MGAEGLVVVKSQTDGSRSKPSSHANLRLVLGIGRQRIHMLVDVATGGGQVILAPVGSEDGRRVAGQTEDGLRLSLHHALLLRLHVVANGIRLGLHVIFLSVAETIHREVGLQRVLLRKFIDATHIPSQSFIAHLVVGTARDVGVGVRAVGNFIRIVQPRIQRQMLTGSIGEFLPQNVRAIACKQWCYRPLRLGVRALHIFQVVVAIAVGAVVGKRRVRAETVLIDVERRTLRQHPMSTDADVVGDTDKRLRRLVGDDVDDTRNGVAAV